MDLDKLRIGEDEGFFTGGRRNPKTQRAEMDLIKILATSSF